MCSRTSSGRVEKEQSMGERGWEGTERREEGPGHGRYSTRRLRAEVGVHDHFRIRHGVIAHPYGILIGLLPSPHRRCPQPPNPKPNVILPFPARPDLPSRERTLPSLAPFGYPRLRMGISAATLTAPARSLHHGSRQRPPLLLPLPSVNQAAVLALSTHFPLLSQAMNISFSQRTELTAHRQPLSMVTFTTSELLIDIFSTNSYHALLSPTPIELIFLTPIFASQLRLFSFRFLVAPPTHPHTAFYLRPCHRSSLAYVQILSRSQ